MENFIGEWHHTSRGALYLNLDGTFYTSDELICREFGAYGSFTVGAKGNYRFSSGKIGDKFVIDLVFAEEIFTEESYKHRTAKELAELNDISNRNTKIPLYVELISDDKINLESGYSGTNFGIFVRKNVEPPGGKIKDKEKPGCLNRLASVIGIIILINVILWFFNGVLPLLVQ